MAFLLLTSLLLLFIPSPSPAKADFTTARSPDALLQNHTFDLFRQQAKSGVVYAADLPNNLSGVKADGIRFRSGNLRRGGSSLTEFDFPVEIVVQPYVTRLIVVLQNLGDRSAGYYDYYPDRYRLLTPVLGFLAYDAAGAPNPAFHKELNMVATGEAITINSTSTILSNDDDNALCAFFDVNGTVALGNQTTRNVCKSSHQGHFALVTMGSPSPPLPSQPPVSASGRGKKSGKWKVVVGAESDAVGLDIGWVVEEIGRVDDTSFRPLAKHKSRRRASSDRAVVKSALTCEDEEMNSSKRDVRKEKPWKEQNEKWLPSSKER